MTRSKALQLRALIEQAATSLSDKEASLGPELFPGLKYDGSLILYKTRINWKGNVKMAAQDLWDREENNPDNAPALWADIDFKDGYRYIHEIITTAEAFDLGERGWWQDELYESLYAANVHNPSVWPDGWKKAQ